MSAKQIERNRKIAEAVLLDGLTLKEAGRLVVPALTHQRVSAIVKAHKEAWPKKLPRGKYNKPTNHT